MLAQTSPSFATLFPCCLCSGLLMSLYYFRVNSTKAGGNQPRGTFVLLNLTTSLARNRQCEAQGSPGQSLEFSCPPTNTDFLEVGVLPQQLSNHINYAASNLPTSSLNVPRFRHVIRLPWKSRAPGPTVQQLTTFIWVGGSQPLRGLTTRCIPFIFFFSYF